VRAFVVQTFQLVVHAVRCRRRVVSIRARIRGTGRPAAVAAIARPPGTQSLIRPGWPGRRVDDPLVSGQRRKPLPKADDGRVVSKSNSTPVMRPARLWQQLPTRWKNTAALRRFNSSKIGRNMGRRTTCRRCW
jgi:hypothetical protein